ncbi:asparaginase [Xylariaceae sp. FL0804]|nr:asparaginase [Xylariaceae sp. FL0804]
MPSCSQSNAPCRAIRLARVCLLASVTMLLAVMYLTYWSGADRSSTPGLPLVVNTWGGPFVAATDAAYLTLRDDRARSALDAVEAGCSTCEANRCDGTVGYGGSPDEACETTLDAMVMDGGSMRVGSVAALRRVRQAVSVARAVLEHTQHTMLAGELATRFAVASGFAEQNLTTEDSAAACEAWRAAGCQPNYRVDVTPDPAGSCGPYHHAPLALLDDPASPGSAAPRRHHSMTRAPAAVGHDTISMVALHASGAMAAGTSTNGAAHKVPGRVGDGPIAGSGSYVDSDAGGCGATGDGDVMMRFLPCYQAVENLRRGMAPRGAAEDAVRRMLRKYPDVRSGVVVVDKRGRHGAAASGWTFTYAYRGGEMGETVEVQVPPVNGAGDL